MRIFMALSVWKGGGDLRRSIWNHPRVELAGRQQRRSGTVRFFLLLLLNKMGTEGVASVIDRDQRRGKYCTTLRKTLDNISTQLEHPLIWETLVWIYYILAAMIVRFILLCFREFPAGSPTSQLIPVFDWDGRTSLTGYSEAVEEAAVRCWEVVDKCGPFTVGTSRALHHLCSLDFWQLDKRFHHWCHQY